MPVAEQEFIFIRLCVLREVRLNIIIITSSIVALIDSAHLSVLCSVPGQRADHGQPAVSL